MKKGNLYSLGVFLAIVISCSNDNYDPNFPSPKKQNIENVDNSTTNNVDEDRQTNVNVLFGNPSDANNTDKNNYIINRDEFVISYNNSSRIANWVSWHLNASWLGNVTRKNVFIDDPELPNGFSKSGVNYSFRSTGFDRGHLCPSGDRTSSQDINNKTFVMTNIFPQSSYNNRVTWKSFEDYLRVQVKKGKEIYVIAGVYGKGGTSEKGYFEKIVSGREILVPNSVWKVALILENGINDISRVTKNTKIYAINIPNGTKSQLSNSWLNYKVSVDDLEKITGYDFFENIPDAIEEVIEAKIY